MGAENIGRIRDVLIHGWAFSVGGCEFEMRYDRAKSMRGNCAYVCKLSDRDGNVFEFPFERGSGLSPLCKLDGDRRREEAMDALEVVLCDLTRDFSDYDSFCSELGYDPERRESEEKWEKFGALAARAENALGGNIDLIRDITRYGIVDEDGEPLPRPKLKHASDNDVRLMAEVLVSRITIVDEIGERIVFGASQAVKNWLDMPYEPAQEPETEKGTKIKDSRGGGTVENELGSFEVVGGDVRWSCSQGKGVTSLPEFLSGFGDILYMEPRLAARPLFGTKPAMLEPLREAYEELAAYGENGARSLALSVFSALPLLAPSEPPVLRGEVAAYCAPSDEEIPVVNFTATFDSRGRRYDIQIPMGPDGEPIDEPWSAAEPLTAEHIEKNGLGKELGKGTIAESPSGLPDWNSFPEYLRERARICAMEVHQELERKFGIKAFGADPEPQGPAL